MLSTINCRWGPSTMANVLDILNDARITIKNNDYVNWFYITYQVKIIKTLKLEIFYFNKQKTT